MTERYRELDFGLSNLIRTFQQGWRERGGSDLDLLRAYAVGNPPEVVQALLVDALRLADSAVPTWAIEALWSAATDRCHDLAAEGWEGRDWLRQIVELCQERLLKEDPTYRASVPRDAYAHLTGAVLDEIMLVSTGMLAGALRANWHYVPGVVPALNLVATQVSCELAFRLLLLELTAYGPGITRAQYDRYVALGAKFEYGELLVEGYEHLVE